MPEVNLDVRYETIRIQAPVYERDHTQQENAMAGDRIPCPFVYSTGKRCTGHVAKVEAYKADLEWSFDTANGWTFSAGEPRSHYHVFCSEKGNHAGVMREDALKLYYSQLPDALKQVINQT